MESRGYTVLDESGKEVYNFAYINPHGLSDMDKDLLKESLEYNFYASFKISHRLYEYLVEKYHIQELGSSEALVIFENMELSIMVLKDTFVTIGIFLSRNNGPDGGPDIYHRFAQALNYKEQGARMGLQYILDENYGGRFDEETKEAASYIIYG